VEVEVVLEQEMVNLLVELMVLEVQVVVEKVEEVDHNQLLHNQVQLILEEVVEVVDFLVQVILLEEQVDQV
jgi:hypothetical protein